MDGKIYGETRNSSHDENRHTEFHPLLPKHDHNFNNFPEWINYKALPNSVRIFQDKM